MPHSVALIPRCASSMAQSVPMPPVPMTQARSTITEVVDTVNHLRRSGAESSAAAGSRREIECGVNEARQHAIDHVGEESTRHRSGVERASGGLEHDSRGQEWRDIPQHSVQPFRHGRISEYGERSPWRRVRTGACPHRPGAGAGRSPKQRTPARGSRLRFATASPAHECRHNGR